MIAKMISAVTANFGTAERKRTVRVIPAAGTTSLNLEPLDLVPQRAVLALVGRPDLLLRHLAEFLDLRLDHRHAERLDPPLPLRDGAVAPVHIGGGGRFALAGIGPRDRANLGKPGRGGPRRAAHRDRAGFHR